MGMEQLPKAKERREELLAVADAKEYALKMP